MMNQRHQGALTALVPFRALMTWHVMPALLAASPPRQAVSLPHSSTRPSPDTPFHARPIRPSGPPPSIPTFQSRFHSSPSDETPT